MTLDPWNEREELPEASAWLLEASAGTGKTFQIAGLVLRLVAEYGLSIDRILTITFTNAATAELRDRIRRRLTQALRELEREAPSSSDPYVLHLASLRTPSRETLTARLRIALRDFDLAGISTIHGFSQRMLTELAFDSGQDTDLELLSEPTEVLEEIVDDELARFFHRASADEVRLYKQAGFSRDGLLRVARVMCGAVTPALSPPREADDDSKTRARVQEFIARLHVVRGHFEGPTAEAAVQELLALKEEFKRSNDLPGRLNKAILWLRGGAVLPTKESKAIDAIRAPNLREARKKPPKGVTPAAIDDKPFWTALQALDDFLPQAEAFWSSFAPLADFAARVRPRYEAEVQRRRVLTFDAMLSRLADKVRSEGGAESPVARRIRERYDAVLVDEFQDTDAAQWTVLDAAFLGHRRLILIGDPKQAIYAFRGADVHVYSTAVTRVDETRRRTMSTNFRSDEGAIRAMNTLWREGSRAFDVDDFDYVTVAPAPSQSGTAEATWDGPGLEIRWLDGRAFGGNGDEPVKSKRPAELAQLAAAEIVDSLPATDGPRRRGITAASQLAVLVNNHFQAGTVLRALRDANVPAVAASRQTVFATEVAAWIATWLDAVAAGGRDREARAAVVTPLFGWTADDLAWALAIADRGHEALAEEAAAGRTPLESRGERPWQDWTSRLHDAASKWPKWGFARVFDREVLELQVFPRLLAMPGGERHATDLRHLFELIHSQERATRAGPAALASWIREEAEVEDQERAQRLESDAEAVRIETIHASKGLEYGHVLLPFGWDARASRSHKGPIVLRDRAGTRVDLSPTSSETRDAAEAAAAEEQRREDLRKLYVALTRAKHRNVVWYGPMGKDGQQASKTALGRLLLRAPESRGHADDTLPSFKAPTKAESKRMDHANAESPWEVARERLKSLCQRSRGATVWSPVEEVPRYVVWLPPTPSARPTPEAAKWVDDRRPLRGDWMVASYSGLAARSEVSSFAGETGDADVAGRTTQTSETVQTGTNTTTASDLEREQAHTGRDEHPTVSAPAFKPSLQLLTVPPGVQPRLIHGRGADYGTFVHEVFEDLDFTSGHGKDESPLADVVQARAERNGQATTSIIAEVTDAIPRILATPLDQRGGSRGDPLRGLPSDFTLSTIAVKDRVDELEFNLRLGAGVHYERSGKRGAGQARPGCVDVACVQTALEAALDDTHAAPEAIEPVRDWLAHHLHRAKHEHKHLVAEIAGILNGKIDLIFRAGAPAEQRFFVVDYKTNMIETSTLGHFTGPWLAWKMATTGYPLQALIYTVALHRHLGVRMGSRYDYDRHVGGYLYLFVRGMVGAETPRCPTTGRCLGVFAHRWTKHTIELMDEALGAEVSG